MSEIVARLCEHIAGQSDRVVELQTKLTALPAMAPENGGQGEVAKAQYVLEQLSAAKIKDVERIDAPDSRVPGGLRPNFVARVPGRSARTLWVMAHLDVVPPGDITQWQSDPWTLEVDGDFVRGRGVEDNQQALVGALLVMEALSEQGIVPDLSFALLGVADEEVGSNYGAKYLLSARPDLFKEGDLLLVPDSGEADGKLIQVAEKGMCWLKVTVTGTQCHASRPDLGRNALVSAAEMVLAVEKVAERFSAVEPLFTPPVSTFVPSRHEENVPNVNTLPGRDVFYIDCRVLPCYDIDDVRKAFEEVFGEIARRRGVEVALDAVHLEPAAPITSPESPVVRGLVTAIADQYAVTPHCAGLGGGTVAAIFRRHGIPAAVWSSVEKKAHQPNETARISKTLGDACVFARMLFGEI